MSGGTGIRYGVYAQAGGGAPASRFAGYFVGNVLATGTITPSPSDASLKTDIEDAPSYSAALASLKPKTYRFRTEQFPGFPEGPQVGLIAQEVQSAFPHLVSTVPSALSEPSNLGSNNGKPGTHLAVNYIGLIPIFVKVIQENQAEIDALERELRSMK